MKKHSLVIPLFLCLFLAAPSVCAQTMSDQQVLEYVKQGMAEGKDQRQLATELARRGGEIRARPALRSADGDGGSAAKAD